MTSNQILEQSHGARERAEEIFRDLLARTHVQEMAFVVFGRHASRALLCELRCLVADLDSMVEAAYLAGEWEGQIAGARETLAQIEADRHEHNQTENSKCVTA